MKKLFFILIALNFLQGCVPPAVIDSSFEHKKLQVNKTSQYLGIIWPPRQRKLPKVETDRLAAYFSSKLSPKCHIRFASNIPADKGIIITKLLKDVGFKKHQIAMDPFTPLVTDLLTDQEMQMYNNPKVLFVAIDQYAVIAPNCPDWSMGGYDKNSTQSYSNFGCAAAHTLAQMIVDPKDLIKPFTSVQAQGTFVEKVMEKYPSGSQKLNNSPIGSGGGANNGSGSGGSSSTSSN